MVYNEQIRMHVAKYSDLFLHFRLFLALGTYEVHLEWGLDLSTHPHPLTSPAHAPLKGAHVRITIWGIRILRIFGYARICPELSI